MIPFFKKRGLHLRSPWELLRTRHEIISAAISPQRLTLSWIQEDKATGTIEIKSYKNLLLKNLEFEKSIVFNPTKISSFLKNFAKENSIKNATFAISICGPTIFEKILTLSTSTPEKKDLNLKELKNLKWDYTYLGPSVKNGFEFYICGMKREILFQYKLLGIKSGIKPVVITTAKTAQIEFYKYLKGENFRQNQLVIDLQNSNYNIQSIFTPETIAKKIELNQNIEAEIKEDYPLLATNIGLFLLGNKL